MPDGSSSAAPVTNPGPSNRKRIFPRLYRGFSRSALEEFMPAVQPKPDELQYFLFRDRPVCRGSRGLSCLEQKITRGAEAKL